MRCLRLCFGTWGLSECYHRSDGLVIALEISWPRHCQGGSVQSSYSCRKQLMVTLLLGPPNWGAADLLRP